MMVFKKLFNCLLSVLNFLKFQYRSVVKPNSKRKFSNYFTASGKGVELTIENILFDKFMFSTLPLSEYNSVLKKFGIGFQTGIRTIKQEVPMSLLAIDRELKHIVKIELWFDPRKRNNLTSEVEIHRMLMGANNDGPFANYHSHGNVQIFLNTDVDILFSAVGSADMNCHYMITKFIDGCFYDLKANEIIEQILELKSFGVYHGDIKPDNIIRSNGKTYFIDFDQAILLGKKEMQLSTKSFFDWMNLCENKHFGQKSWLRHFKYSPKLKRDLMKCITRKYQK